MEYIVVYCGHTLGAKIEHDLRNDLFNHIHKLSFGFFDNTKTGYIMSRVVNDLFQVVEVAHHFPENVLISSLTIIGALIILFSFNWQLSLIIFTVIRVRRSKHC